MAAEDDSIPSFLSLSPSRRRKPLPRSSPQLAFTLFPPEPSVPHSSTASPSMSGSTPPPSPPPAPILYTVRQLINELRHHLESTYTGILNVEGEISNCRPAASGHIYFTLKDGDAQLPVVLFRSKAQLLRFRPRDGFAVEVRGRISVYESRGQLQLIAESLRPRGTGALQLAFEQLRDRLRAEGLFERPRTPLPPFPHCVGIITSPSGAALRDIINVVRRRHARLNLLIYPAVVQGPHCAAQVAAGIRFFNRIAHQGAPPVPHSSTASPSMSGSTGNLDVSTTQPSMPHSSTASPSMSGSTPTSIPCVDLILIARGGGSLEDLAGFNDETLARAIAASRLPVVSAIGHEIDHTITDFVADLRAPTPSAAAELITAAQHRIEERVLSLEQRVARAAHFHLLRAQAQLARLSAPHVLARLRDTVSLRHQRIDDLRGRLQAAILAQQTRRTRARTIALTALEARLRLHDPTVRLALASRRLATLSATLRRLAISIPSQRRTTLDRATLRLEALSPLAVLNRGYAIVYSESGNILRTPAEAPPGSLIRARLAQGTLKARVLP